MSAGKSGFKLGKEEAPTRVKRARVKAHIKLKYKNKRTRNG